MNSNFQKINLNQLSLKLLNEETFGVLIGLEFTSATAKLANLVASESVEQVFVPYSPEVFLKFGFRIYPVYCVIEFGQFEKNLTLNDFRQDGKDFVLIDDTK